MIKRLRVTVDGNTYDVTVETADDQTAPAVVPAAPLPAASPGSSPAAASAAVPTPLAPASAPATTGSAGPGDVPSPLAGRASAVLVWGGHAGPRSQPRPYPPALAMKHVLLWPENANA